jgi:putative ABC transport system substrate-binding protein
MIYQLNRRGFITRLGGALVTPLLGPSAASAQQPMPTIGFLHPGSAEASQYQLDALRRGLAEAGYIEGRNVIVEYRWAEERYDRLPELAADLVRRHVDVIAAGGSSAPGLAAKAATKTIPIVFQSGGDPVADGLADSMNRPGANVTGVSRLNVAIEPKRLELLHESVPTAKMFAFLVNGSSPRAESQIQLVQRSMQSLDLKFIVVKANAESEIDGAFDEMAKQGVHALLVGNDPTMTGWADRIAAQALRYRLPSMFSNRPYVAAGGLMSYDSSLVDSYRQVGVYIGRVLKGEKPADLPILEPTKFEFILNLKTAKVLGLEIPLKLHAFADEVIE